jgi:hypothetical protein
MEPEAMTGQTDVTQPTGPNRQRIRQRHTIAAVVYFLYGLFLLFGAQYLTPMRVAERGMSNPKGFFILGAFIVVLFPLLIYSRFALALSLWWQPGAHRTTLFVNFTLLLAFLVVARVVWLMLSGAFARTWLHTAGVLVAAINAIFLLRAGLSLPVWISRESQGS